MNQSRPVVLLIALLASLPVAARASLICSPSSGSGLAVVPTVAERVEADHWDTEPFPPSGKTVWALPAQSRNATGRAGK
ncbi:hypothetical protein [Streptomyces sp. NPDC051219]|uniref:hypothetical protein n=1 Tax=Streptomyces sp. NPDC051219 TaxID=3155283 RepID=UPI003412C278